MTESQYAKMVDYFEQKLSPDEEVAFMLEVNNSEVLQQEFEMELLLRYGLDKAQILQQLSPAETPGFESAEDHVANIKNILEDRIPVEETGTAAPVIKLYNNKALRVAAAIIILALTGMVLYNTVNNNKKQAIAHDKATPVKDSIQKIKDSAVKNNPGSENILIADAGKLFNQAYKDYMPTGDDPVEISNYLQAYHNGNYREVLHASKDDYATKGVDNDNVDNYMQLYKGLSYLKTGKTDSALLMLSKAQKTPDNKSNLYFTASWYTALAYLKQYKTAQAKKQLSDIASVQPQSPYNKEALKILKLLQ